MDFFLYSIEASFWQTSTGWVLILLVGMDLVLRQKLVYFSGQGKSNPNFCQKAKIGG